MISLSSDVGSRFVTTPLRSLQPRVLLARRGVQEAWALPFPKTKEAALELESNIRRSQRPLPALTARYFSTSGTK